MNACFLCCSWRLPMPPSHVMLINKNIIGPPCITTQSKTTHYTFAQYPQQHLHATAIKTMPVGVFTAVVTDARAALMAAEQLKSSAQQAIIFTVLALGLTPSMLCSDIYCMDYC